MGRGEPGEPGGMHVLLIEDDPDHEELVRRAFRDGQACVALQVAHHGEEAVDYLFRRGAYRDPARSPRPRLILLDLRLPRRDGLEVLAEIKSSPELRAIPAVVLTTSESDEDVARAFARHANSDRLESSCTSRHDRTGRPEGASSAAARSCMTVSGGAPGGTEQAVDST